MLGRRTPQLRCCAAASRSQRVKRASFYGWMRAGNETLFQDDNLKSLYSPATGRPSLPPSLLAGVGLGQTDAGVDRPGVPTNAVPSRGLA